ncbi:MAG TPA: carbon-nitrogen hydrolase family protein, partial [Xanthobacteraceae bacterium]|nr:carbon-nitrogen hydrolase family protein [Xanthobacteraceae bacterium]
MSSAQKFRAGLLQMRSGRKVAANIDAAAKLAREGKAAGADYIQTPEMTNLMEQNRKLLFSTIAEEEHDPSLAAFRELA